MIEIDFVPKPSAFEVRKKSESGGSLDLTELDVLLNSGGLLSSNKENSNKSRKGVIQQEIRSKKTSKYLCSQGSKKH